MVFESNLVAYLQLSSTSSFKDGRDIHNVVMSELMSFL